MNLFRGKLNSDYFKAYSLGRYVTVFVENEDDVPFWNRVLRKYSPSFLKFRFPFAFRDHLQRGKADLLKLKDGVGDFMLLCVDSDYDYLLQDATADSQAINGNDYIFQTYTYSVENYKCFAESLGNLCIQASLNDEPLFDFVEFLQTYSTAVYELFLFSFYFRKIGDTSTFPISEFPTFFGIQGKVNISHNAKAILQELRANVEKKIASLQASHPALTLQALASELASLGLRKENTYLFIRGHTVYHNLVLILLKSVESVLRGNKQAEFAKHAANDQEFLQKQNEYKNQILDIETLLTANTDYDSCFLMEYIQRDVEKYMHVSQAGRANTALSDDIASKSST